MATKKKKKVNTTLRWVGLVLVTLILIGMTTMAICGVAFAVYINKYINPHIDINLDSFRLNLTSFVYYIDKETGEPVELERLYGTENRIWAGYEEIPQALKDAFVSIEDARFWTHNGVDWKRSFGAMVNWIIPIREGFGGGSTITQQLIKNITGDKETTIQRKVQEIMRALELEKNYDKDEILELYLNTIFLGQNCYGVKTAAEVYFGKELSELTLAECASIAGITKNPSKYDPFRFPEFNKERQELVLHEMLRYGKITQEEYDEAVNQELDFKKEENIERRESKQSYFVDQVINDVLEDLQEDLGYSKELATRLLYSGGLKIYATIDPEIQAKMDEVFLDPENFPDIKAKDGSRPEAAMVLSDPYTGDIIAMYGGRGEKTVDRGLNRATQSRRQPGSAIKPLSVYAPALEYGIITPTDVFDDAPKDFNVNSAGWPKNQYSGYRGAMTVSKAVEISNNTVPVEILQKLTPENSYNFLTANLGISTLVKSRTVTNSAGEEIVQTDIGLAPLALGGLTRGVTVAEMNAAYCAFVNKGTYIKPRTYTKVLDSDGNVVLDNKQVMNVAMKEKTANYVLNMMQGVVTGSQGTGAKARIDGISVAAKTGTTSDDYDRWFVGLTPYYCGTVWFGFDMNYTVPPVGTNPALVIWKAVMDKVLDGYEDRTFNSTEDMVQVSYCIDSGGVPTEWCNKDPRGSRVGKVYVAREDMPKEACTVHTPVQVDQETGKIATEFCPAENIVSVALMRRDDRIYPRAGIVLGDQRYVLPIEGIPEGMYPASVSSDTLPYYQVCDTHTSPPEPEPEPEPEPDPEPDPEPPNIVWPPTDNPGEGESNPDGEPPVDGEENGNTPDEPAIPVT